MHCDARALSLVSLVFGEVFFGGSPSLHDLFCTFWQSAFSVIYILSPTLPMHVVPTLSSVIVICIPQYTHFPKSKARILQYC